MLTLVYDTETTGLVRGTDYTDPNMPFLASIAAILYDEEAHRVVASQTVGQCLRRPAR